VFSPSFSVPPINVEANSWLPFSEKRAMNISVPFGKVIPPRRMEACVPPKKVREKAVDVVGKSLEPVVPKRKSSLLLLTIKLWGNSLFDPPRYVANTR